MADEWKYKQLPVAANGIAPARWNPETQEWEVYVGDFNILEELQAIKQQQQQILQRLDGTFNTQLTGSYVEELTIVNALAITDTEPIFLGSGTGFDTTKYKRIKLLALSTLDAQVAIRFRYRNVSYSTYFWDGSNWVSDQEKQAIIGSGFLYDLNSIWDFLNDQPVRSFGLRIQAQSVPTSGALTVYLWGVLK